MIVKFSSRDAGAAARRWRDILVTEFHASEVVRANGFPAAETRLLERDGRLFLESLRFDRAGEFGRMPLVSLQAVDAEFAGVGSNWPATMGALVRHGLVNPQHQYDAAVLWYFGRLINNTDMHLGNLSLAFDGAVFRLLPVYDMCSIPLLRYSAPHHVNER